MRRGLLATGEELSALSARIGRKPFDSIAQALWRRCSLILQTRPISETQWRAAWGKGIWSSALQAARTTQGRILDLVIAHHLDPNGAYRDRAIEELDNLISWGTWVDPCHPNLSADLCTAEAAVAATVGLDWLWDDLGADHRETVREAILSKAVWPYHQAVEDKAWWYSCYHNWNAVVNGGCGLAALAFSDELPPADNVWKIARAGLDHYYDALGHEGGWDEGTGYWAYGMRYLLLLAEAAARTLDDQGLIHRRGMEATGLFPVYFTPNGQPASFGDGAVVPLYGTFYLLTRYFDRPELLWWLDTYAFHHDASSSGWSAAGLALLMRPDKVRTPARAKLEPLKVFHRIGWAALADQWPRPKLYAAVKTGDVAANHSHHDTGSVQVQVDGEMLLPDAGAPAYTGEYFSDARGSFYQVQARAHNTITVSRRDHQPDTQGAILDSHQGRNVRWVACDTANACGDNVHAHRHVLMLPGGKKAPAVLIVLDDVRNAVPETVEQYWHTQGRFELDDAGTRGRILGRRAKLNLALAASVPAAHKLTTRKLSARVREQVLRVRTGKVPAVLLAAVFSTGKLPARIAVMDDGLAVTVTVGPAAARFVHNGRSLLLDKITGQKS